MIKKLIKNTYFLLKKIQLFKSNVIIDRNVSFKNSYFKGFNKISKNTYFNNSEIGKFSYINRDCILNNVKIGAFSSIAPKTEIIYGTHPTDLISTHPIFYSSRKQCGISFLNKNKISEFIYVKNTNLSAVIGNDVWIGYNVKIIEGITISDGAIILSGSIVTKDVEPYSIVGGVPAKHIKFRFNTEKINLLLKLKWWDNDNEWIRNNLDLFNSPKDFFERLN